MDELPFPHGTEIVHAPTYLCFECGEVLDLVANKGEWQAVSKPCACGREYRVWLPSQYACYRTVSPDQL